MKRLFLVRHAKSSWADKQLDDRERPLNNRGRKQADAMGPALVNAGVFNGAICASDAVRARQTAERLILGAGLVTVENPIGVPVHFCPELYTFDAGVLRDWLQHYFGDEDTLTLIGHNPALQELAGSLLKHPPSGMPTGSVIEIALSIKSWQQLGSRKGRLERFLTPKDVSYKLFQRNRKVPADDTGHHVTRHIPAALQHQYERLRDLEPGVRLGYDPEFLHQYRVALRRSRAIAEPVVEVSADKTLVKAVKVLKRHGRATSTLRDLSVLLAELRQWLETEDFEDLEATGVEPYFRALAQQAHKRLRQRLDSARYRQDMKDWRQLIQSRHFRKITDGLSAANNRRALDRRISKHDNLMTALSAKSPNSELHRLRKLLKRIRYLAELDKQAFRKTLKILKTRQQLFGSFHDVHVQIELLAGFKATLAAEGIEPGGPAALTRLTAALEKRQATLRTRILKLGGIGIFAPKS